MIRYLRSLFAWKMVRDSGVWLYYENAITGERTATRYSACFQPLDLEWLDRKSYRPTTPAPSPKGL